MAEYVLIACGVVVVLAVAGAVLVRRLFRRTGRRIGGWQLRLLEIRAHLLPIGPRRDAARLRYRLHAELRATGHMLEAAPQGLVFRADAATLLQELASTAAALDGELAAIERFMDPAQQRAAIATVRPQIEDLIETTYSARQTILRTAVEDRSKQLAQLRNRVATQAAALETYRKNGRELSL
jgi:hypothetical protein